MRVQHVAISTLKYFSLLIGCFVALIPLSVVFMGSFKTGKEFRSTGVFEQPENWFNFSNYVFAFTRGKMLAGFMNTGIILLISIIGTIILGTMAAYVLDRFEFKLKKVVVGLFLLATLVPGVTTQVSTFQIVNGLGLFNSRMAAIVLFMGTDIISIYIFLQFLRSIPRDLDEAAILDGASYFTIYRKIILPLLKPAIATVIIIKGVAIYNEFYIPFLYMPKSSLGVISTSLFKFKGPFGSKWEVICAGIIIAMIPTLIVFLALQRYIYNGFTSGSVK